MGASSPCCQHESEKDSIEPNDIGACDAEKLSSAIPPNGKTDPESPKTPWSIYQWEGGSEVSGATNSRKPATLEENWVDLLLQVRIVKRYLEDSVKELAEAMQPVAFRQGALIARQGCMIEEIFVIASGEVSQWQADKEESDKEEMAVVAREGTKVGTLERADLFEESSFEDAGSFSSTYMAETDVVCLVMRHEVFEEMGLSAKIVLKRRNVVGRSNSRKSTLVRPRADKTDEQKDFLVDVVQKNDNLSKLLPSSTGFVRSIVDTAWRQVAATGDVIITQGDEAADNFYIIDSGSFGVYVKEAKARKSVSAASVAVQNQQDVPQTETRVKTITRGDSFGEMALLYNGPRSATVKAESEGSLWVIGRSVFKDMLKKIDEENIKEYIGYLDGIEAMNALPPADKEKVAKALEHVRWGKGDIIYTAGAQATGFYILLDGSVDIFKDGKSTLMHANVSFKGASAVRFFGDRSLIENRPRQATVTCVSQHARALCLDRNDFHAFLGDLHSDIHKRKQVDANADMAVVYCKYLETMEVINSLSSDEMMVVARALKPAKRSEGDVVFRRGEMPEAFYILLDGSLQAFDGVTGRTIEASLIDGKFRHFGDKAILDNTTRRITVKVTSKIADMLLLEADDFQDMFRHLQDHFLRYDKIRAAENRTLNIQLKELKVMGLIGIAAFGPVELCQHTITSEPYAMKTLCKGLVMQHEMQTNVLRERECWLKADSPFVVKLHALYNQKQTLHLLCDYLPGGSVANLYSRKSLYGSADAARYYLASITQALKHLHKRRVVHRDIRPENMLLCDDGHAKLVDFGLSKCVLGKTYTTCGTPDYMAPEVLVGTGHARAVDWWSMGIMAFEFMVGDTPFSAPSPMDVYSNVMRGISTIKFPSNCTPNEPVGEFIIGLLQREPVERLAMRQGGIENIVGHSWYAGFDWHKLRSLEHSPPHKPILKSPMDRSHYKAAKKDLPKPVKVPENSPKGWDKDFTKMNGKPSGTREYED